MKIINISGNVIVNNKLIVKAQYWNQYLMIFNEKDYMIDIISDNIEKSILRENK